MTKNETLFFIPVIFIWWRKMRALFFIPVIFIWWVSKIFCVAVFHSFALFFL